MPDNTWEFYCAPDGSGAQNWGWRLRRDGVLTEEAVSFATFIDCYRNAVSRGFSGSPLYFAGEGAGDVVYRS
jgi:hypothetical protein